MELPKILRRIVDATSWRVEKAIDRYVYPAERERHRGNRNESKSQFGSYQARSEILSDPTALLPGVIEEPDQDYVKKVLGGAEYKDLPLTTWVDWSIRLARAALIDHAMGNFSRAAMLTEAMMGDDRIQSAFDGRVKGITKTEPVFIPSKAAGSKVLCDELMENWDEIFPEQVVEELMRWAVFEGFALAEIIWEPWKNQQRWIPHLKVWHPYFIYYRTDIRKYVAIAEGGTVEIDENDPKWFLYTPHNPYRGWIMGRVRSCAIPWLVRQFALRDLARFSEVHGMPMRLAKYPAQAPTEDKARFVAGIRNLGAESTVGLPIQAGPESAEWGVELVEAKDTSWEAFLALRDACNSAITLSIRGTNLTSEVGGGSSGASGSRAAAQVHQDEEEDYTFTDRRKMMRALRHQLFPWYAIFNFGNTEIVPTRKSAFVHPEDEDAESKFAGMEAACRVVVEARKAGAPIDAKQIYARADMPLIEGREDEANDEEKMAEAIEKYSDKPDPPPGFGGGGEEPISGNDDRFGDPDSSDDPEKFGRSRMIVRAAGKWDESKHSRSDDGKFGSGPGDSKSGDDSKESKETSEKGSKGNDSKERSKKAEQRHKEASDRHKEVHEEHQKILQEHSQQFEDLKSDVKSFHTELQENLKNSRDHLKTLEKEHKEAEKEISTLDREVETLLKSKEKDPEKRDELETAAEAYAGMLSYQVENAILERSLKKANSKFDRAVIETNIAQNKESIERLKEQSKKTDHDIDSWSHAEKQLFVKRSELEIEVSEKEEALGNAREHLTNDKQIAKLGEKFITAFNDRDYEKASKLYEKMHESFTGGDDRADKKDSLSTIDFPDFEELKEERRSSEKRVKRHERRVKTHEREVKRTKPKD